MLVLSEYDGEDSVRSAAALVHVRRRHRPRLVPLVHQVVDVGVARHGQFTQILDIGSEERVLADTEVSLGVRVQEISDTFTLYLHIAYLNSII